MTRAADILRERAEYELCRASVVAKSVRAATREKGTRYKRNAVEWLAVADLMEATERYIAWTEGNGEGYLGHDLLLRLRDARASLGRVIGGVND